MEGVEMEAVEGEMTGDEGLAYGGATSSMGTDQLGRDLFARVLHGARIALWVALVSIGISFLRGLVLGMIAGHGPRWLDALWVPIEHRVTE